MFLSTTAVALETGAVYDTVLGAVDSIDGTLLETVDRSVAKL